MEVAELLGVHLNAPVAYVDRAAVDQSGTLVMVAAGTYRGDLVRIDVNFSSTESPASTQKAAKAGQGPSTKVEKVIKLVD